MTGKLDQIFGEETQRLLAERLKAETDAETIRAAKAVRDQSTQRALNAAIQRYIDSFRATGIGKFGFQIENTHESSSYATLVVKFDGKRLKHYAGSDYFIVYSTGEVCIYKEVPSDDPETQWRGEKDVIQSKYHSPERLAEELVKALAASKISNREIELPV